MGKKQDAGKAKKRSGPLSLHPLTPEQALGAALNTPLPQSKVRAKRERPREPRSEK